ncbi:interferon alpha/beta receptor 1 [Bombina bombina]|uniref:interferon alpha/beta receptor 1 n=1 Tax=Bombina bombina TaxID=8345 RepID=UPI00235ABCCA|nr:interferon alpha/beta receptor 1 [Bombina bombina]
MESTQTKKVLKSLTGCLNVPYFTCNFTVNHKMFNRTVSIYVRAERLQEYSPWSNPVVFSPFKLVEIGPPAAVNVKSRDGRVKIKISSPDAKLEKQLWRNDLNYSIVVWEKKSNKERTYFTSQSSYELYDLPLGEMYCLKVQALNDVSSKRGLFSPVECFKVKGMDAQQIPQNVRVKALNINYVLKWEWDYEQDPEVTFSVEKAWSSQSDTWYPVSQCANITASECNISDTYFYGTFYFRVSAFSGRNKTLSRKVTFSPFNDNVIGPPRFEIKNIESTLYVAVTPPILGHLSDMYTFSYHLVKWRNSSEEKVDHYYEHSPYFAVDNLEAPAIYCIKVQVVYQRNKSGLFSDIDCVTIHPAAHSLLKYIIVPVLVVLIAFLSGIVYVCACPLQRFVKHIFFPSGKLPSSIEKGVLDSPKSCNLLLHEEEKTDLCCILNSPGEDHVQLYKSDESFKASSVDSGNYSNEEETT